MGRVQVKVRLPEAPANEVRYANHIMVTFGGADFLVTLAQVRQPLIVDDEDRRRVAAMLEIPAHVVGQYAVPTGQFLQAISSIVQLIDNLRAGGLLPPVEDDEAENDESRAGPQ